jgi:hypothetical protein
VTGHARGLFREAAPDLPVPPLRVRERLKTIARGEEAHRAAMLALPCMTMLAHRPGSPRPIAFPFTVGAWNLERCLSPETSADVLRREGVAVALLSELDVGMARSIRATSARPPRAQAASPAIRPGPGRSTGFSRAGLPRGRRASCRRWRPTARSCPTTTS